MTTISTCGYICLPCVAADSGRAEGPAVLVAAGGLGANLRLVLRLLTALTADSGRTEGPAVSVVCGVRLRHYMFPCMPIF